MTPSLRLWSIPAPGSSPPSTDLLFPVSSGAIGPRICQRSTTNNPLLCLHKGAALFQLIGTVIKVVSSRCPCRCPYSVLQTVSSLPAAVSVLSGFYLESLHHSIKGSHGSAGLLYLSVWGHLPPFLSYWPPARPPRWERGRCVSRGCWPCPGAQ